MRNELCESIYIYIITKSENGEPKKLKNFYFFFSGEKFLKNLKKNAKFRHF